MDPILVKAIREFMQKQAQLTKAGVPITAEHIEEFFRARTSNKYGTADAQKAIASIDTGLGPRNLARSAVQGAVSDFGDEGLGALPEAIGGGEGAKDEMRLRQDLFRGEHPVADAAAGAVGSILPALLMRGKGPASVKGAVGQGAAIGAGAGALSGLGRGEGSLAERAPGAVMPALLGAGLGAAIPAVVGGAKTMFSPTLRATRRLEHAVEQSGGENAMVAKNADMAGAGRGDEVMLGDLSDRLRLEADFAANNSDDVLAKLAAEVKDRHLNATHRLMKDTRDVLGSRPNATARAKALKQDTQAFGDNAYEALRKQNPNVKLDPETIAILKQPVAQKALAAAQEKGLIGAVPDLGRPSFTHLQDAKRALDGMVSAAFRKGDNTYAHRLAEVRDAIETSLLHIDGYEAINAQYALKKGAERALKDGQKAWLSDDTDAIADALMGMGDAAREQFRYGIAARLYRQLASVKTNRNAAQELMDASVATQEKLQIVFGSKPAFDRYMSRVASEAELAKMKGPISGSATARRLSARGFDPLELGLSAASGGIPSMGGNLLSKAMHAVPAAMDRATARAEGPMLMTKGTGNIDDFLRTLTAASPVVGKVAGRALPVSGGFLLNALLARQNGK